MLIGRRNKTNNEDMLIDIPYVKIIRDKCCPSDRSPCYIHQQITWSNYGPSHFTVCVLINKHHAFFAKAIVVHILLTYEFYTLFYINTFATFGSRAGSYLSSYISQPAPSPTFRQGKGFLLV